MCCPQRAQRRAHREAASGAALTGLVYVLHSSSSGSGSGSRHRTPRAAVPAMPAVPLCEVATQMLSVSSPCCAHPSALPLPPFSLSPIRRSRTTALVPAQAQIAAPRRSPTMDPPAPTSAQHVLRCAGSDAPGWAECPATAVAPPSMHPCTASPAAAAPPSRRNGASCAAAAQLGSVPDPARTDAFPASPLAARGGLRSRSGQRWRASPSPSCGLLFRRCVSLLLVLLWY